MGCSELSPNTLLRTRHQLAPPGTTQNKRIHTFLFYQTSRIVSPIARFCADQAVHQAFLGLDVELVHTRGQVLGCANLLAGMAAAY